MLITKNNFLRVLQLCHKPPFPSVDGGCIEMAKMSLFFHNNENYSLDIVTYSTQKHPFISSSFKEKVPNANVYSVPIQTKTTWLGGIKNLLLNTSYHYQRFKSTSFKKVVLKLLSSNTYDYILVESIYVSHYIKEIKANTKAKIIYNSPNIEYEIWERLAKNTPNFLKSSYLKILAKQLKKKELKAISLFDGIIAITNKDAVFYQKNFPKIPCSTISFKLNLATYKDGIKEKNTNEILFYHLGAMDWQPNQEGMKWFIGDVWQQTFLKNTACSFHLAGKDTPRSFSAYNKDNFFVHGYIPSLFSFAKDKDVMVVPLFSGSGLRIKIIEAMAMKKCVIATTIALEGIDYKNKENVILANTAEEFIQAMQFAIQNPDSIKLIGEKGYELVSKKFNTLTLEKELLTFFSLIDG